MSDVEDELLALAGGDVSDEEEMSSRASSRHRSKSKSELKNAPPKRARKEGDESEEGEAYSAPGTPDSQQSAPMDESDSDADVPQPPKSRGTDDGVKYAVDGLFVDEAEKAHIMSMREIEREQILAERREENERIRQNRMLRQLVVNQDRDKDNARKRKASAADLEDVESSPGQRKTGRVRTKVGGTKVGETSAGIDSLRRARDERHSRMLQRERDNADRRNQSPDSDRGRRCRRRSDSWGYDGDSDVEWATGKPRSRTPEIKQSPLADLKDMERVRVGRSRFAEYCYYPGFEEAMTGCFVRVNVGPDPTNRTDVYRMAVINGFTTGRPYAVSRANGSQIVVETYVRAAHGKAEKEWPFIMCSDKEFTDAEWHRYRQVSSHDNTYIPKKPALAAKIDQINALVTRTWTDAELTDKVSRQNRLQAKFSGVEREQMERRLAQAQAAGDEHKVAKLQDELDKMEIPRLAFRTSLLPTKAHAGNGASTNGSTQQDRLAQLNAENRRRNTENVRKAQRAEILKAREIEVRLERGEHVETDQSRRLKTRTKFLHDMKDNVKKAPAQPPDGTAGAGTCKPTPMLPPHMAKLQELQRAEDAKLGKAVPTVHKPLMDDDIIGALDLDIDVEI